MSEMARELVQQALDQDYNKASKTFGEIMSAKLSDVLDQEKIKVASSIYNGIDPNEEDDQYEGGEEENIEDAEDNSIESDLSAEDDDEMEEDSEEIEDEDISLEDEEDEEE